MRMDVILQRWLPIAIIMAACYGLIFITDTNIESEEAPQEKIIELPPEPRDYPLPQIGRNPFILGPKEEPVKETGKPGVPVKKKEIDPASLLFLNAIFWDTKAPMVSLNGKVLGVGGEYAPNIKVEAITTNSVILNVNGRQVIKLFKE